MLFPCTNTLLYCISPPPRNVCYSPCRKLYFFHKKIDAFTLVKTMFLPCRKQCFSGITNYTILLTECTVHPYHNGKLCYSLLKRLLSHCRKVFYSSCSKAWFALIEMNPVPFSKKIPSLVEKLCLYFIRKYIFSYRKNMPFPCRKVFISFGEMCTFPL